MNLSALEPIGTSFVIVQTLTIFFLSLLLVKQRSPRRDTYTMLKTWHQKETASLSDSIDKLRDSSLQELFALRRSLELAALDPASTHVNDYQSWIQQLESLHTSLNDWIESVSPSFSEESLALAIAAYLKHLKSQKEHLEFSVEPSEDWRSEDCPYINKAIFAYFQELTDDIGVRDGFENVQVSLSQLGNDKHLRAEFRGTSPISPGLRQKVYNLCQIIPLLADIECHAHLRKNRLRVDFKWANR